MNRAEIHVPSILGDVRKPNTDWDYMVDKQNSIACIRLMQFNETSAAELRTVVEQLQKEGLRGLVLDLRTNPGGLLNSAREVADLFLTEGKIVSTKGRDREEDVYEAKADGTLLLPAERYPMALINRYAPCQRNCRRRIADHNRAIIVGERSFGKGSVQNVIKMENAPVP